MIKNTLANDNGLRYNVDYINSNIILKCELKYNVIYLDLSIQLNEINGDITTAIHYKKGKLNTLLDNVSNNSLDHFQGVYASESFRSIVLNDDELDHRLSHHNLLCKLRERGWHSAKIRLIQSKFKLSYVHRLEYLNKINKKFIP